jgi:hypothetical protein
MVNFLYKLNQLMIDLMYKRFQYLIEKFFHWYRELNDRLLDNNLYSTRKDKKKNENLYKDLIE